MASTVDHKAEKPHAEVCPHYFLVRPDKTAVPLIALDELHADYEISGVPGTLKTEEIEKWNMARVGDLVDHPNFCYHVTFLKKAASDTLPGIQQPSPAISEVLHDMEKVEIEEQKAPSEQGSSSGVTPDQTSSSAMTAGSEDDKVVNEEAKDVTSSSGNGTSEVSETSSHATQTSTNLRQDDVEDISRSEAKPEGDHPSKTKNAATPGIYGKKKFCTYWIRTGNCDYVQEGCKYLHVIPDEETRLRIGIRDMPRWAKEDLPVPDQNIVPKKNSALAANWRSKGPIHVADMIEHSTPRPGPKSQANAGANGKRFNTHDLSKTAAAAGTYQGGNMKPSSLGNPRDMISVDMRQVPGGTFQTNMKGGQNLNGNHYASNDYVLPRTTYRAPDQMPQGLGANQRYIAPFEHHPSPGRTHNPLGLNDDSYSDVSDHSRQSSFSINGYFHETRLPDYGSDGTTNGTFSGDVRNFARQNGKGASPFGAIGTGFANGSPHGSVPASPSPSLGGVSQKSEIYHPRRFAAPGEPKYVVTSSRTAELMKSMPQENGKGRKYPGGKKGHQQDQSLLEL